MQEILVMEREGRVFRLTLNRPAVGNAINQELAEAFTAAALEIVAESEPHIVVIQSTGSLFCAGGDVQAMSAAADPSAYLTRLAATIHEGLVALRHSPHIVISRVHAAAAGAGLALVLNSDLVVASTRAVFLNAYGAVGLTPDCGVSRLLPEVVGPRRASELVLTNRALTADVALDWGLINEVIEPDALDARVDELVLLLAAGPAYAQSRTLALMRDDSTSFVEHLEAEVESLAAQMMLEDTTSRMAAFVARSERRKATQ